MNHLPGVTPIMVGRQGALTEPTVATVLPTAAEFAAGQALPIETPVAVAPAIAPVELAPVAPVAIAPTATSSLNAVVRLHTTAVIELPWNFIVEHLQYAFLTSLGEICVADYPPSLVTTNGVASWELPATAECLVLGMYSDTTHWQDSVTMRPDDEEELAAEVVEELEPEPVPVKIVAPIIETKSGITQKEWEGMSRRQQKRHRLNMSRLGKNHLGEDL